MNGQRRCVVLASQSLAAVIPHDAITNESDTVSMWKGGYCAIEGLPGGG
jgi:hypothetical protein